MQWKVICVLPYDILMVIKGGNILWSQLLDAQSCKPLSLVNCFIKRFPFDNTCYEPPRESVAVEISY